MLLYTTLNLAVKALKVLLEASMAEAAERGKSKAEIIAWEEEASAAGREKSEAKEVVGTRQQVLKRIQEVGDLKMTVSRKEMTNSKFDYNK